MPDKEDLGAAVRVVLVGGGRWGVVNLSVYVVATLPYGTNVRMCVPPYAEKFSYASFSSTTGI